MPRNIKAVSCLALLARFLSLQSWFFLWDMQEPLFSHLFPVRAIRAWHRELSVRPSAESHHGLFMLKLRLGSLVSMLYYGFPPNFDLHSWESHLHSAAYASLALIFHNGVPYLSKCDSSPNPPPTPQWRCRSLSNCYENRGVQLVKLLLVILQIFGLLCHYSLSSSVLHGVPKSRVSQGCFSECFHG